MANLKVRDSAGIVKELAATGSGTPADPISPIQKISETGVVRKSFFTRVKNAGSDVMNVNGSITPVVFSLAPPIGEKWRIHEAIFHIVDAATMTTSKFGARTALVNGIVPRLNLNAVITPLLDFTIKTNSDLASISGAFQHLSIGAGDESIVSKMDFTVSGQPIRLDGDNSDAFECVINDDLSTMTSLYLLLIGYIE